MAKAWSDEDLARNTFYITLAGVGAFIAVVFLWIL
jgi:hypothetical protein